MKRAKIFYWVFNGLFCFMMTGSAIPDVLCSEVAVQGMHRDLGYPLYFLPLIGVAKLLGVIAILVPGFPRVKEWAYAGFAFDLIGATISIIASGGTPGQWGFMAMPLAFFALAYIWHRKVEDAKRQAVG